MKRHGGLERGLIQIFFETVYFIVKHYKVSKNLKRDILDTKKDTFFEVKKKEKDSFSLSNNQNGNRWN